MILSFIRCNFGRILYQLINNELILMKYKPTGSINGLNMLHNMHDSRYLIFHEDIKPTEVSY